VACCKTYIITLFLVLDQCPIHPSCNESIEEVLFFFFNDMLNMLFNSLSKNLHRYGPIFRTGLVGRAVVVSADQDFNRYLVQQEGRLVELWYLDTFSKLFGQEGQVRTNATGYVHKYLRTITLNHFGIESLKQNLLPHIEKFVRESLHAWSTQESIDVKEAALIVCACSLLVPKRLSIIFFILMMMLRNCFRHLRC